jgi:hypothetical protein
VHVLSSWLALSFALSLTLALSLSLDLQPAFGLLQRPAGVIAAVDVTGFGGHQPVTAMLTKR